MCVLLTLSRVVIGCVRERKRTECVQLLHCELPTRHAHLGMLVPTLKMGEIVGLLRSDRPGNSRTVLQQWRRGHLPEIRADGVDSHRNLVVFQQC